MLPSSRARYLRPMEAPSFDGYYLGSKIFLPAAGTRDNYSQRSQTATAGGGGGGGGGGSASPKSSSNSIAALEKNKLFRKSKLHAFLFEGDSVRGDELFYSCREQSEETGECKAAVGPSGLSKALLVSKSAENTCCFGWHLLPFERVRSESAPRGPAGCSEVCEGASASPHLQRSPMYSLHHDPPALRNFRKEKKY